MAGPAPILLLSMPQMADPNFSQTVILLCDYTDRGAFGLVVNRQMDEPAWTMVKTEPPVKVDPEVKLWVGGPVDPQRTWVLSAEPTGPDDEQQEICPGVVLSVSHQLTLEILQAPPSNRTRVIVGYAGWGPGQLDDELAASSWLTMTVDAGLIFSVPHELMWETALRRLGTDPSKLQTSFGVHCIRGAGMNKLSLVLIVVAMSLITSACRSQQQGEEPAAAPVQQPAPDSEAQRLQAMIARFAPVDIAADTSALPENERQALAKLVEAAKMFDALFLRQVWSGNETMLLDLVRDTSEVGQRRLHYFLINRGPWSRLDEGAPFIAGAPEKPDQANFYPAGASKADVEAWLKTLPEPERRRATGFFTTIRRGPDGRLMAVPYSVEYQGELAHVSELLREAAALTTQPTLKNFLEKRAAALLTDDYYDSDVAWMELDASIEPTIGPYEVYEDEWFNYKAAFEAFITLRDDAETQKLARFSSELQEIENNLPIDPKYRNPKLGALAPIRVVNTVFSSGDANRGVQTAAFNLPNDERVVAEKGSKRVMLKNNQEAKFRMVLQPIAKVALAAADQSQVAFDAFFTHILMHELMHGLGPHNITVGGRATTVRQEMKELSSALEEAKADVSGLFALQFLVDRGKLDAAFNETMYRTYLASMFRSIRFGINEAHGRGVAMQLNYFLDNGGVTVAQDGTFAVNAERIRQNIVDLTRDIMTMQALGDYAAAKQMIETLAVIRPSVQTVLDRLKDVPVDIEPRFVAAPAMKR